MSISHIYFPTQRLNHSTVLSDEPVISERCRRSPACGWGNLWTRERLHQWPCKRKMLSLLWKREVFVRDHLAEYRTGLALRRTFLSYLRTALAFFGGGLAMIKFSGHPLVTLLGWILLLPVLSFLFRGSSHILRWIRVFRRRSERQKKPSSQICNPSR